MKSSSGTSGSAGESSHRKTVLAMSFASLGVVFGDIGTSPIYSMRESLHWVVKNGGDMRMAVLGVVSLLLWALILIVTLKYVVFLMRADNRGEGGILSLVVLVEKALKKTGGFPLLLGLVGAAFFFGDAMITPAMTVLSAIEGLNVIDPRFNSYVVPLTIIVLVTLFSLQYRGTAGVASVFAPVTAVWFLVLGLMGLMHISDDIGILAAFNPWYGLQIPLQSPGLAILVFGGVFLAVTGGEALYADMGHFGRKPIRLAWLCVVFPSLILNYLGQGAFILAHPAAAENPFFLMAPAWSLVPLVIFTTLVAIIASQAVITGAFSIAQQAISLGILPRMAITHTSETEQGQIYVSQVNWLLFAGVITLVILFKTSSNLAAAYGIAVNTSMVIDTILAFIFFWKVPVMPRAIVFPCLTLIFVIELMFLAANGMKVAHGGYVPLLIGGFLIILMGTWLRGRNALAAKLRKDSVPLQGLLESMERRPPTRVAGAAVFLQTDPNYAPAAMMHNLKHNRVLHDILVFMYISTSDEPRVENSERVTVQHLPLGAYQVEARFGYMEQPDVPAALRLCEPHGLLVDPRQASYFLGHRTIKVGPRSTLPQWQQRLFIILTNQSSRATDFFRIPPDRVVELGMQLSV